jgi:glycosyltransferase involved in cell wall biosynthesis
MTPWTTSSLQTPKLQQKPVTIAFVIFALGCGGAEVVLLELVKGLDRLRFTPIIISLAPPSALSAAFEASGVEVHHLGFKRVDQAPLVLLRAWRLVRRLRPALLQGVMFHGDLAARLLRLMGGTTRVVTAIHTTSIGSRAYEQIMHWSDRYTDAVTAVSQVVASAQVQAGSIQADKVTVIHNGIDLKRVVRPSRAELDAQRARLNLCSGDRVLLCVARLEPVKEHALLLRAFKAVSSKVDNLTLLLVGTGRLEGQLRTLAANLGISAKVRFAGPVSPIAPILFLAEAFVLCSSREGLPIVVLEAMAAELPMVLTAVGGIPEIIEHEKTGLLVPSQNEEALADALERLFKMSARERSALAFAGRRLVEERFCVEHMVAATQDLYERVLAAEDPEERLSPAAE